MVRFEIILKVLLITGILILLFFSLPADSSPIVVTQFDTGIYCEFGQYIKQSKTSGIFSSDEYFLYFQKGSIVTKINVNGEVFNYYSSFTPDCNR